MSEETDRKRAELELAELADALEEARDAFHAKRGDEGARVAFKDASKAMADARVAYREKYSVEVGPGDAAPAVDTVQVKAGVKDK